MQVLQNIVLLLVTVTDIENLAVHCYLKPLDGHKKIYQFSERIDHDQSQTEFAIYHIGKYGSCSAAVRNILPGSEMQDRTTTVVKLAYISFPNLGAVIGVGVAYGIENKVNLCDILVSSSVSNYNKVRVQREVLPTGDNIDASSYLKQLFHNLVNWPNDEIKSRLKNFGMERTEIQFGKILSAPCLSDDPEIKIRLHKSYSSEVIGIEMEGTNLFATAQKSDIHTIIVKAVCDFGDGNNREVLHPTAALLAADCVSTVLSDTQIPEMLKKKGTYKVYIHVCKLHTYFHV